MPSAPIESTTPIAASAPVAAETGAQPSGERAVIVAVTLGTMLAPLNSTMIAVALPRIIVDFQISVATAGWLVTAYLIAMASLQPVAGKLGDRFGRRPLILGGLVAFGVASLGATLASHIALLFAFRVLQAVAGAVALPNGTALVRDVVPLARRARSFGLIGSGTALAAALGPPVGGLLVEGFGWRSIFFMNVPLVAAALLFGWRAIPATRAQRASRPFDVAGAVALSALLIGLTALLTFGKRAENALLPALGGVALAVCALAFVRYEARNADPVLQPRFFRVRSFAAANGAIALSNLAMYSTLLTVPILLARRAGWPSAKVGAVLVMLSGAMVVCSPLGGRLADRFGRRRPVVGGLALLTLGCAPLALAGGAVTLAVLLPALAVAGGGIGLSSAGMQTAAVEAVGAREAGVASGIFSTSRYFGSIVGSSVLAGLLSAPDGFRAVFVMVAVAAGLSAVAGLAIADRSRETK